MLLPVSAASQFGGAVRIEGYWDRNDDAPGIIGEITFSSMAGKERTFGATSVRSMPANQIGMSVLRSDSLRDVIEVKGRKEMIDQFFDATPTEKLIVLGMLDPDLPTLTLTGIEHPEPGGE
jgi:hypothetical protein